jgi:hypothetical protein
MFHLPSAVFWKGYMPSCFVMTATIRFISLINRSSLLPYYMFEK